MNEKELFRAIGEISDDLIAESENPRKKIKRAKTSKILLVAAAVTILLSFSAFAARNMIAVSRHGYSSKIPTFTSVPSQKMLLFTTGITPKIPSSFSCGYEFKNARISRDEDRDADGKAVEKFKSLICNYTKGEERFSLHIDASTTGGMTNDDEDIAETYQGSDIQYLTYTNKVVPGNYQLTEQDKADQKAGKYVFSFGNDKIEILEVQIVSFRCQGLNYSLCALDTAITKEEMIQTAREIIDYQNGGTHQ